MRERLRLHQDPGGYQKSRLLSLRLWESRGIWAYWLHPLHPQRCGAGNTTGSSEEGNRAAARSGKSFRLNMLGWEVGDCAFLTKDLRFKLNLFVLLTFININRSDITCGEPSSPSRAYTDFADCQVVTSLWCKRQNQSWAAVSYVRTLTGNRGQAVTVCPGHRGQHSRRRGQAAEPASEERTVAHSHF